MREPRNPSNDGRSQVSPICHRSTEREDRALEAFRKAVRMALTYGFDAGLLAEEIAQIEREFHGEEDDDE